MTDYTFLLTYPPCAGTSLGVTQHQVTIQAERPTDAFRRLWTTIDDMRVALALTAGAVPDVHQWHGPRQLQHALIAD